MTNDNAEILVRLLLCGLLGLIGQGIRLIVGLKKLREESEAKAATSQTAKAVFDNRFDGKQLWLSLFIGFVAGCLVSFTRDDTDMDNDVQLAIIAAGYAGTDFIEGVLKKILPTS